MAKFWDSSSGLGDAKWLRNIWTDILGGSDHSSGLPHLGKGLGQAVDSLLGPEGFIAYPKRSWDHWADQLTGGGNDDNGSSRSTSSNSSNTDTDPVVDETPPPDPGLDDDLDEDEPLAGDVQMSSYLAQRRRQISNKRGRTDTMLTRGSYTKDTDNRLMLS